MKKKYWQLGILFIFALVIVIAFTSKRKPDMSLQETIPEKQNISVVDSEIRETKVASAVDSGSVETNVVIGQVEDTVCFSLPTMLELGSVGCIPCEKMRPIMAQLEQEHGDLINIEFHDVRKNRKIAEKYRIRLIPTQIFLKADSSEFFRHEGFFPKKEIEKVFREMGVQL